MYSPNPVVTQPIALSQEEIFVNGDIFELESDRTLGELSVRIFRN